MNNPAPPLSCAGTSGRKTTRMAMALIAAGLLQGEQAPAAEPAPPLAVEACLAELVVSAPDHMTAGEMRAYCRDEQSAAAGQTMVENGLENAVARRLKVDELNVLRPFTLMAHRQNYFLFGAHNFQGYSSTAYGRIAGDGDRRASDTEAQFQLSLKTALASQLFDRDLDIFAGYTVRSFWQVYKREDSSPFRETNHEPEMWLQTHPDIDIFGIRNVAATLGVVHQSNGQSGDISRSWNRVYADLVFHRGNFAFSIKPWARLGEDDEDDDNADITDYLGHGELRLAYTHGDHTFSLMSRNNIESDFSRGAVELGWSFPLFGYPYLKGYVQYFSGYGESLIDYNRYVNRLGMGILLTDLL